MGKEKECLRRRVCELTTENSGLQNTNANLRNANANLQNANDQLARDKNQLQQNNAQLNQDKIQLQQNNTQLSQDKVQLQEIKDELQKNLDAEGVLKKQLEQQLEILQQRIDEQETTLEVELQKAASEKDELTSLLNFAKNDHHNESELLKSANHFLNQKLKESEKYNVLNFLPKGNFMWPILESKTSLNTMLENTYKKKTGKTALTDEDHNMITFLKHAAAKALNTSTDRIDFNNNTEYENEFYRYANDSKTDLDNTNFYGNPYGSREVRVKFDSYPSPNQITKKKIQFFRNFENEMNKTQTYFSMRQVIDYSDKLAKTESRNISNQQSALSIIGIGLSAFSEGAALLGTAFSFSGETIPFILQSQLADDVDAMNTLYNKKVALFLDELKQNGSANTDTSWLVDLKSPSNTPIINIINVTHSEQELKEIIEYTIEELRKKGNILQGKLDNAAQDGVPLEDKTGVKQEWKEHLQQIEAAEFASSVMISLVSTAINQTSSDPTLAKKVNAALSGISAIGFATYKCSIGALQGGPLGLAVTVIGALQNLSSHFSGQSNNQDTITPWLKAISVQVGQLAIQLGRMEVVQYEIVDRLKGIAIQIRELDFNFSKQLAVLYDQIIKHRQDDIDDYRFKTKSDMVTLIEKLKIELDSDLNDTVAIAKLFVDVKRKGEMDSRSPAYTGRSRLFNTIENFEILFKESNELEKFSLLPRAMELLGVEQKIAISTLPKLPDLTTWMLWASIFSNYVISLDATQRDLYKDNIDTIKNSLMVIKRFLQDVLSKDALERIAAKLEQDLNSYCDDFENKLVDTVNQNIFNCLQTLKDSDGNLLRRMKTVLSPKVGHFDDFTDLNDRSASSYTGFALAFNKKNLQSLGVSIRFDSYGQDNAKYQAIVFNDHIAFNQFFTDLEVVDGNFHCFNHEHKNTIHYLKNSSDGKLNLYHSRDPFEAAIQAGLIKFEKDSEVFISNNHKMEKGRIVFLAGALKGRSIPFNKRAITIKHPNNPAPQTICVWEDTLIDYKNCLDRYQSVLPDDVVKNNCLPCLTGANIVHFALNQYFCELKKETLHKIKQEQEKRNVAEISPLGRMKTHIKLELELYIYLNKFLASMMGEKEFFVIAELENLLEKVNEIPDNIYLMLSSENKLTEVTPTHAGLRIRFDNQAPSDILNEIRLYISAAKKDIHDKLKRHALLQLEYLQADVNITAFSELEKNMENLGKTQPDYWSTVLDYFNAITNLPNPMRADALKNSIFSLFNTPDKRGVAVESLMLTAAAFAGGPPAAVALTPVAIDVASRLKLIFNK